MADRVFSTELPTLDLSLLPLRTPVHICRSTIFRPPNKNSLNLKAMMLLQHPIKYLKTKPVLPRQLFLHFWRTSGSQPQSLSLHPNAGPPKLSQMGSFSSSPVHPQSHRVRGWLRLEKPQRSSSSTISSSRNMYRRVSAWKGLLNTLFLLQNTDKFFKPSAACCLFNTESDRGC